ncbi:hypothetical protein GO294_04873 [Ralstonia solanacearum]|nr:hypothetical protein [Ralstonia solanacearum]
MRVREHAHGVAHQLRFLNLADAVGLHLLRERQRFLGGLVAQAQRPNAKLLQVVVLGFPEALEQRGTGSHAGRGGARAGGGHAPGARAHLVRRLLRGSHAALLRGHGRHALGLRLQLFVGAGDAAAQRALVLRQVLRADTGVRQPPAHLVQLFGQLRLPHLERLRFTLGGLEGLGQRGGWFPGFLELAGQLVRPPAHRLQLVAGDGRVPRQLAEAVDAGLRALQVLELRARGLHGPGQVVVGVHQVAQRPRGFVHGGQHHLQAQAAGVAHSSAPLRSRARSRHSISSTIPMAYSSSRRKEKITPMSAAASSTRSGRCPAAEPSSAKNRSPRRPVGSGRPDPACSRRRWSASAW